MTKKTVVLVTISLQFCQNLSLQAIRLSCPQASWIAHYMTASTKH